MSEVMQFEITSKDGVTLETEGRICEKHIRVVPRLAPLEAELGGKYPVPDGYTGFGDVTVKPKLLPITIEKAGSYLVPEGYAGHGEIKCEPLLTNLVVQNNGTYRIPDDMVGYEEVQVEVYGDAPIRKEITIAPGGRYDFTATDWGDMGFVNTSYMHHQAFIFGNMRSDYYNYASNAKAEWKQTHNNNGIYNFYVEVGSTATTGETYELLFYTKTDFRIVAKYTVIVG